MIYLNSSRISELRKGHERMSFSLGTASKPKDRAAKRAAEIEFKRRQEQQRQREQERLAAEIAAAAAEEDEDDEEYDGMGDEEEMKDINGMDGDDEEDEDEDLDLSNFDKLLRKGDKLMIRSDLEGAQKVFIEALKEACDNDERAAVHDSLAQTYVADPDTHQTAIQHLLEAEKLKPGSSHERYLALGQLHSGMESLHYYQQGIAKVKHELGELPPALPGEDPDVTDERNSLNEVLSNAYCAIADLYVTDLCDEDNAQNECEKNLHDSVRACPSNPEPYRAMGNLKMILGEHEEARKIVKHAFKLVMTQREEGKEMPEFVARCELAKMLLELQEWTNAAELFVTLIEEDRNIAEIWYLAGVALTNIAQSEEENRGQNAYAAAMHFVCAQRLLAEAPDEEMEQSIKGQIELLQQAGVDMDVVMKELAKQDAEEQNLAELPSESEMKVARQNLEEMVAAIDKEAEEEDMKGSGMGDQGNSSSNGVNGGRSKKGGRRK